MTKENYIELKNLYSKMLFLSIMLLLITGLGVIINPINFAAPVILNVCLITFLFILKEVTAKIITKC